jgi:hypothetical protein
MQALMLGEKSRLQNVLTVCSLRAVSTTVCHELLLRFPKVSTLFLATNHAVQLWPILCLRCIVFVTAAQTQYGAILGHLICIFVAEQVRQLLNKDQNVHESQQGSSVVVYLRATIVLSVKVLSVHPEYKSSLLAVTFYPSLAFLSSRWPLTLPQIRYPTANPP